MLAKKADRPQEVITAAMSQETLRKPALLVKIRLYISKIEILMNAMPQK